MWGVDGAKAEREEREIDKTEADTETKVETGSERVRARQTHCIT